MSQWTKISHPRYGKGASWRHASGWELHHCGHPTANWPYYLKHPDGGMVVSFNGLGFVDSATAKYVIECIARGDLDVTREDCVEDLRRALVTAMGREVPS